MCDRLLVYSFVYMLCTQYVLVLKKTLVVSCEKSIYFVAGDVCPYDVAR